MSIFADKINAVSRQNIQTNDEASLARQPMHNVDRALQRVSDPAARQNIFRSVAAQQGNTYASNLVSRRVSEPKERKLSPVSSGERNLDELFTPGKPTKAEPGAVEMPADYGWRPTKTDRVAPGFKIGAAPAQPYTTLSGHGEWGLEKGGKDAHIIGPKGTTFFMLTSIGTEMTDPLGGALENGKDLAGQPAKVFKPGSKIPNLTLHPPAGLKIGKGIPKKVDVKTVKAATKLKDLLQPSMGNVVWSACASL